VFAYVQHTEYTMKTEKRENKITASAFDTVLYFCTLIIIHHRVHCAISTMTLSSLILLLLLLRSASSTSSSPAPGPLPVLANAGRIRPTTGAANSSRNSERRGGENVRAVYNNATTNAEVEDHRCIIVNGQTASSRYPWFVQLGFCG